MVEFLSKKIHSVVKELADSKFKSKTSIYKSSWIVKEYIKRGGKFAGEKPDENTGLRRWFREKWVDLNRPTKDGFNCSSVN
jgi:hypothetical protein